MSLVNDPVIDALGELGLTQLEALTYVALLKNGPSTGYRLAQHIEKPASNVYRIIDSLIAKQMVLTEEGPGKRFRALPYGQMLDRLKQKFQENQALVAQELSRLEPETEDNRVYRLNTSEQVFERCRAVMESAQDLLMIDAFPAILSMLEPEIRQALERGITVRIKAYEPVEIDGASISLDYRGEAVLLDWNTQWLVVIADGREYVQASFGQDSTELVEGIWTASAFLAWIAHGGMSCEMTVDRIQRIVAQGGDMELVRDAVETHQKERYRRLEGRNRLTNPPADQ